MNAPAPTADPVAHLASPDLPRLIIRLALPAVIGLSINALQHAANMAFLGVLGPQAVSAVSSVFPLLILMGAVGEGIGTGTASYVSRMLGAGRIADASRIAQTGLMIALATGFTLSLAIFFFLDAILDGLGVTPGARPLAQAYLTIFIAGYTFTLLQIFGDLLAISEGNSRFGMTVLAGAFLLNLVLDPIFIFVLGFGVAGAAMATFVAQFTAVAVYAVYFTRGASVLSLRLKPFLPSGAVLKEIAMVGVPSLLASSVMALAFLLVYSTASTYGDAAVAGIGIAVRIFLLGALPVFGFCLGTRAVLGYGWGAGDYDRVLRAVRFMALVTTAFCTAYSLGVLLLRPHLLGLFSNDPEVLVIATRACFAFEVLFPLFGLQVVLMTYLQSVGKAALAALVLLAPQGYFLIPGLVVLPRFWGMEGLFASQILASTLTAALVIGLMLWQSADLRRRSCAAPEKRLASSPV